MAAPPIASQIRSIRKLARFLVSALGFAACMRAYAINPPQWDEFAKGESVDIANVRTDGDIISGYVRDVKAGTQRTTLYEVDCKGDKIRVHSDVPRYIAVPVEGGGRVIEADDGFRTVEPGSRNAGIENAICGIAQRQEAEKARHPVFRV